jgi:hypothetical protein
MARALSIVLALLIIVHLIRPLGLPGLKKRGDFWKLAALAMLLLISVVALRPN